MGKKFVLGIDLGGTKIACALSDLEGNIILQSTKPTESQKGKDVVFKNITSSIDEILKKSEKSINDIECIGIGAPGPLDAVKGIIVESANLPFANFPLIPKLKEIYEIPIFLENDGNAACLGEYIFGAGKGTKNMIYVTVSTGVGAGAIVDGKLVEGSTHNSLEIGHSTIEVFNGEKCNCGNYGCVEAYASGTAIGKQAVKAIKNEKNTSLSKYENPTSYEVYIESKNGDKVSNEILDRSFTYLGVAMANLLVLFDPEKIVIGGGVSKMGDLMFNKVREVVNERALKSMIENCEIVPSSLNENTGIIGAVALAIIKAK